MPDTPDPALKRPGYDQSPLRGLKDIFQKPFDKMGETGTVASSSSTQHPASSLRNSYF
jgi:hypothetical protein